MTRLRVGDSCGVEADLMGHVMPLMPWEDRRPVEIAKANMRRFKTWLSPTYTVRMCAPGRRMTTSFMSMHVVEPAFSMSGHQNGSA